MADKDYKAFIVEGEAREPQVIDNYQCFPGISCGLFWNETLENMCEACKESIGYL